MGSQPATLHERDKKFMCMKWLTKYPFQASRPPLPSRSAGRNPSLLAFGLFTLLHLLQLFNFFCSSQRQLLAKHRLLVSFWTLWTFYELFGLFGLIWACMSSYEPKKFAAGLPMLGKAHSDGTRSSIRLGEWTPLLLHCDLDHHSAMLPELGAGCWGQLVALFQFWNRR